MNNGDEGQAKRVDSRKHQSKSDVTILVAHEDVAFDDQIVYVTGHAYTRCEFRRCTMVLRGTPMLLHDCEFTACKWDISMALVNLQDAVAVGEILKTLIIPSLAAFHPDDESSPDQVVQEAEGQHESPGADASKDGSKSEPPPENP